LCWPTGAGIILNCKGMGPFTGIFWH